MTEETKLKTGDLAEYYTIDINGKKVYHFFLVVSFHREEIEDYYCLYCLENGRAIYYPSSYFQGTIPLISPVK